MSKNAQHQYLYLLTAALLVTHEIGSAYWKDWNLWSLFGLPGAELGFLAVNFVLVVIVLLGFKWLVQGNFIGRVMSLVLVLAGLFVFGAHAYFIFIKGRAGPQELVAFFVLLALILVSSLLLLRVGFQDLFGPRKKSLPPSSPTDLPSDMQQTVNDSTLTGLSGEPTSCRI